VIWASLVLTVEAVLDPETWRALVPDIERLQLPTPALPAAEAALADLRSEGYLNQPGVFSSDLVAQLADGVRALAGRGIPPVFLWIYAAPWRLLQGLDPLLQAVLGPDYLVLPEIWTWFVPPSDDGGGWRPHRDQSRGVVDPDGSPHSLTVWLPLSDATLLNGCIYLVPMHVDEDLRRPGVHNLVRRPQDVRAEPATAGSILLWNGSILHWGARSSRRAPGPRISIACQVQRARAPDLGRPLLPPLVVPSFDLRVFLVARALLGYSKMTPLAPEALELAQALKARLYERIANG
jgi:hypothetical protein